MQPATRNDLDEWPSSLESVDAWPKVKWPRRLTVPSISEESLVYTVSDDGGSVWSAKVVYSVDEATGFIFKNDVYSGEVRHAGGGCVMARNPAGDLWYIPLAEIELVLLERVPTEAEKQQGAC